MKIKLLIVSFWIIATLLGCGILHDARSSKYHVLNITFDGPICVANLSKNGVRMTRCYDLDEHAALMVEEGDLLYIFYEPLDESILLYRYDPRDGDRLSLSSDTEAPFKVLLNDRLVSLCFWGDPTVWQWIENCDAEALRHLRSLCFFDDIESPNLELVQKIATVRPNIGLSFDEDTDASILSEIISLFTPAWLFLPGEVEVDESLLPNLKKLECLYAYSSEHSHFIEELPSLESLIFDIGENGQHVRFDKIPKLRSLTLIDGETGSLAVLKNSKRLKNLFLVGCDIEDIRPIADLARLQGLGSIDCEGDADFPALGNLPHIKWASFPPDISQEEFSDFLSKNSGLEVIELLGCGEISDLSPLSHLTSIRALNLDLTVEDLSPLYQLKDLELLTLPDHSFEERQYQELREALPNTQIVIGGACLGTGWILLIIPFIAAGTVGIRLFGRRSSK